MFTSGFVTDFDLRQREAKSLNESKQAEAREQAKAALSAGPFTVTSKPEAPPGGTKHDYWSMGPYWWPDPDKDDGLPYVRKDGQVNPEAEESRFDRARLKNLGQAVAQLTQGWLTCHEPALARRVVLLLRTFFLEPDTKMNPSLTYGQAIPGRCDGRGIGIIETVTFIRIIDDVLLFQAQGGISHTDVQALRDWFVCYQDWLLSSEHGRDERIHPNNHGTWFDTQLVAFALFTGRNELAKSVLSQVPARRIDKHIEPDGSQPHELARTRSFDYSLFNLEGLMTLARLGEHVNVNLWDYHAADGRSIGKAIDFLRPYADPDKPWPYQQIDPKRDAANPGLWRDSCARLRRILEQHQHRARRL